MPTVTGRACSHTPHPVVPLPRPRPQPSPLPQPSGSLPSPTPPTVHLLPDRFSKAKPLQAWTPMTRHHGGQAAVLPNATPGAVTAGERCPARRTENQASSQQSDPEEPHTSRQGVGTASVHAARPRTPHSCGSATSTTFFYRTTYLLYVSPLHDSHT